MYQHLSTARFIFTDLGNEGCVLRKYCVNTRKKSSTIGTIYENPSVNCTQWNLIRIFGCKESEWFFSGSHLYCFRCECVECMMIYDLIWNRTMNGRLGSGMKSKCEFHRVFVIDVIVIIEKRREQEESARKKTTS